jgi:glutathione S-transferase
MTSMTLFYTLASPYARKVRIVAREKHLAASIDEVLVNLADAPDLIRSNPLGKIPALVRADGFALYDSPVICAYLNSIDVDHSATTDSLGLHSTGDAELIPEGEARWLVLRAEALADGVLDAAVACMLEGRRPAPEQSATVVKRQQEKVVRAIAEMEAQLALLPSAFNLAHIAFISALGYVDFRLPELTWRAQAPKLAAWFATADERESARATRPHA